MGINNAVDVAADNHLLVMQAGEFASLSFQTVMEL